MDLVGTEAVQYRSDVFSEFALLNPKNSIFLEYVWVDGSGQRCRSKRMQVKSPVSDLSQCPIWNYCGSATGQMKGNDSELLLKPVALYNDPFLRNKHNSLESCHKLVLCESILPSGQPAKANNRSSCVQVVSAIEDEFEPWFAMEQEWVLVDSTTNKPLGFPQQGYPEPQGPYYCSVGGGRANGRDIAYAHYGACLYAGVELSGLNGEVLPGQWEFQCGPSGGIKMGDDLWIARYILDRISEMAGLKVTLDPKPVPGDWNGSGAHMNFSTKQTRAENGILEIEEYIKRLQSEHQRHIKMYDPRGGEDNVRRLTGKHETAPIDAFTCGVAAREASIRIPRKTSQEKRGYLEDRRPAGNADPYSVIEALVRTCMVKKWD